jgi:hypothetical protein
MAVFFAITILTSISHLFCSPGFSKDVTIVTSIENIQVLHDLYQNEIQ